MTPEGLRSSDESTASATSLTVAGIPSNQKVIIGGETPKIAVSAVIS